MQNDTEALNRLYLLSLSHIISKAVTLAAKIRLDQYLSIEPVDITVIAKQFNFDPQAMYRFLRLLDIYEIVKLSDNKQVTAGKLLPYLDRILSPHILDSYQFIENLDSTLQNNQACYANTFGLDFYPHLLKNPEKLEQFKIWCTKSAHDWLSYVDTLYDFTKFNTIVDVGGGEGNFLAKLLAKNPTQQGILFDQPNVIKQAITIFNQYQIGARVKAIGGDFFQSVPAGGDAYIICRTLLNWDDTDAVKIINKCHEVMTSDSTLLVIDFVVPQKGHPQYEFGIINDLNLMACVNSTNRTEQEWRNLIEKSAFTLKQIYTSPPNMTPKPVLPIIILEMIK